MTGQFLYSTSDRSGRQGRYRSEESITLEPGQETEVSLMAPEVSAVTLFLDGGKLEVLGDKERIVIPRIQWGDRHRQASIILPGESIFLVFRNTADEKATILIRLDLPARLV